MQVADFGGILFLQMREYSGLCDRRYDARAIGIYDVIIHVIRIANSVECSEAEGVTFTNLCNNSLSKPGPRGLGYLINGKIPSTYDTWRDHLVRLKICQ